MLSPIALATLAAATLGVAAPTSMSHNSGNTTLIEVFERATPAPVSCGPDGDQRAWTQQVVQDAFDAASVNINKSNKQKPTYGSKYYPHRYKLDGRSPDVDAAINAIPECVPVDGWAHWLFPIADPTYSGGDPKEDRIVMFAKGTQSPYTDFTFCLAISHRGQANNAFVPCA